jgi:hypothetical protein
MTVIVQIVVLSAVPLCKSGLVNVYKHLDPEN